MSSILNNQDYLKQIVKESKSIKECLNKVGLLDSGKNYKTFHKYINKFKISILHFETRAETIKRVKCNNKKYELSDILVENFQGSITGNTLKEYLYSNNLKKRNCEICSQGEIWMGNKISLILDHINGDNKDNRIGNLRILCPNCNATTDTFAGRNIGRKNKSKIKLKKQFEKDVKLKNLENEKNIKIELILNSNIDFSKKGWGVELGKIFHASPQYSLKWVKINMPEFYKTCFKHKDNNCSVV